MAGRTRDARAREVTLEDKYVLESGRAYLTGLQALVRLPLMQRSRDEAAGLDTAGFISGYRGSPLAGYDQQLWEIGELLTRRGIRFQPGVNEELAATAVWGTQQVVLHPGARHDGVFAAWYGKGPGVDRCGDVFKHANFAGTSRHGGVLVIYGDDPGAKSSTLPHQSDQALIAAMIPVLQPADVQELIDFGLLGWALSRYSGCWVGLKALADVVDSSASVDITTDRIRVVEPTDFVPPPEGLHIRPAGFGDLLEMERRLVRMRLPAAQAFARAVGLDRIALDSPRPRLGIVAVGKAYPDVRCALQRLGIDERAAAEIGIRIYKVGMAWPLDPVGAARFARGLERVLVVEEKRGLVEEQLCRALYDLPADVRPAILGKHDERGVPLLPADGEIDPVVVASALAPRLAALAPSSRLRERIARAAEDLRRTQPAPALSARVPTYCSGCPHNTSTQIPEGSRAIAGIGCHAMAVLMPERRTYTWTQMGGEGANWIGQSPFTDTEHVFANLGDGTYFHSGLLAVRAAVSANVNITYKLLFNDAVAMTGGQPIDGKLDVPALTQQLYWEGVRRIAVVTDDPGKYGRGAGFAPGTTVDPREDVDRVQDELRRVSGVSVLVYDQTCAAELRRRRKRGLANDPSVRVFINDLVCEGCGDCNTASNCVSVEPLETDFGRKRTINQSSCNKDYTCLDGYCPSFVTVHGGSPRRRSTAGADPRLEELPLPPPPTGEQPTSLLITGIGGTGVTTIGALVGMAAHIDRRGVTVLDVTGLAQKNGAVTSHVRIARTQDELHTVRIGAREADVLIACDLVVATGSDELAAIRGDTTAIVNDDVATTADFQTDPDFDVEPDRRRSVLRERIDVRPPSFFHATRAATELLGDSIFTNVVMLGYAWQLGVVPVSLGALERAIALNSVAVGQNLRAFAWGRLAAHDPAAFAASLRASTPRDDTLEGLVERRERFLEHYQDRAYARRYRRLVERAAAAEARSSPGARGLAESVARYYFKLLAYKDEYEVARLYADEEFARSLSEQMEGDFSIHYHFAPQWGRPDRSSGRIRKRAFGPWMKPVLKLLAKGKRLRGTIFDPFGYLTERRMERSLIADYELTVEHLLDGLTPRNHRAAVAIASLPEDIRGFGIIKRRAVEQAAEQRDRLLARFDRLRADVRRSRRGPQRPAGKHRGSAEDGGRRGVQQEKTRA